MGFVHKKFEPFKIGDYWVFDREEENLRDTVNVVAKELIGLRGVNTSFDSGCMVSAELPDGWSRIGDCGTSPIITKDILVEWPLSHMEYFDEWYFFKELPDSIDVKGFCNLTGPDMTIADWEKVKGASSLPQMDLYLESYKPEYLIGSGYSSYLISKEYLELPKPMEWRDHLDHPPD